MIYFYTCEEKTFLLAVCDLLKESWHDVLCFKTLWLDNLVNNWTAFWRCKIPGINFHLTKDNLTLTITSVLINILIKDGKTDAKVLVTSTKPSWEFTVNATNQLLIHNVIPDIWIMPFQIPFFLTYVDLFFSFHLYSFLVPFSSFLSSTILFVVFNCHAKRTYSYLKIFCKHVI